MTELQKQIKAALESFLDKSDPNSLQHLLTDNSVVCAGVNGDYPNLHRIMDILIGKSWYRVCRKASADEQLFFVPIDAPDNTVPGVPLWLEGEQLRKWIEDEEAEPSEGPINWDKYKLLT